MTIDPKVKIALESCIKGFEYGSVLDKQEANYDYQAVTTALVNIFSTGDAFEEKLEDLDKVIDDYPKMDVIRQVLFDLLLTNFFGTNANGKGEDYLESEEWAQVEEDTAERGTELLNLFLYLNECAEAEEEPSLDDFLENFLLVEEDEFQEEAEIYEDIIANQMLEEAELEEVARVAATIKHSSPVNEIFYPFMVFFNDPDPDQEFLKEAIQLSSYRAFDAAVLFTIIAFQKNKAVAL